jgi:hypothetical protein
VFWTEPPWPSGVEPYSSAARVEPVTFEAMMRRINVLTERYRVPWYVFVGRAAGPFFDRATGAEEIVHPAHGRGVLYMFNNGTVPDGVREAEPIMCWLASKHECVGDPMAGYGNVGRFFVQTGKRCVLTDVNRACIGVIAKVAQKWSPRQNDHANR